MLIKNPGLLTRKYNQFIGAEMIKSCPYCKELTDHVIFHQFLCPELYKNQIVQLGDPERKLIWETHDEMVQ